MNSLSYHRYGTALVELIVAGGLMVTAIGLVATCVLGGRRLQRMQLEHSLAVDELTNQLERLTSLAPTDIEHRLERLEPSEWAANRLPDVVLTAERIRDDLGDRIELQLQWKRLGTPPPLVAVGWLLRSDGTVDSKSEISDL